MFYGGVLKPGVELSPSDKEAHILHLSAACLVAGGEENCQIFVEAGKGKKFCIAVLSKDRPQVSLDLFVRRTDEVKLRMKGKGEIHLAGYWEPDDEGQEDEDEGMMAGGPHIMEADSSEEEVEMPKKNEKKGGEKKGAKPPPKVEEVEEEDEGESDAEIVSEGGDEGESDEEEDEDEDGEEEENHPMFQQLKQKLAKAPTPAKGKAPPSQTSPPPKKEKRKAEQAAETPPQKKAKGTDTDDNKKYEKDLEAYLKTHGRTQLSALGSQVKRPASVDKLGQFMRERPTKFAVENGFVSLLKA